MFVNSQTEFRETNSPSNPSMKLKSLSDVYARCNVNINKPKKYNEVATDNAWKKTMNA